MFKIEYWITGTYLYTEYIICDTQEEAEKRARLVVDNYYNEKGVKIRYSVDWIDNEEEGF